MHALDGCDEEKLVLVATAKCLADFPQLQQSHPQLWTAMRDEALKKAQGERGRREKSERRVGKGGGAGTRRCSTSCIRDEYE